MGSDLGFYSMSGFLWGNPLRLVSALGTFMSFHRSDAPRRSERSERVCRSPPTRVDVGSLNSTVVRSPLEVEPTRDNDQVRPPPSWVGRGSWCVSSDGGCMA